MTMSSGLATGATGIRLLLGRYGEELAQEQVGLQCPFATTIPEKMVDGEHVYVNIDTGTNSSVEWTLDGGDTTTGSVSSMEQGYEEPKVIRGAIQLGRVATHLAKGKKGVPYFKQQSSNLLRHLAQRYGRSLFATTVHTFAASGQDAAGTSFTTTDPSGFRVGATYDAFDTSSGVEATIAATKESFIPTAITTSDGVTYTITHAARTDAWNSTGGETWFAYQQGGRTAAPPSLEDMCADADLHNITKNLSDWTGNLIAAVGTLNQADVRLGHMMAKRKAHEKCTHMVGNSENEGRLIADMNDQGRFFNTGKKSIDAYDFNVAVDGLPMIVDENCPDGSVFLINTNYLERITHKKIGPVIDGATASGKPLASVIVNTGSVKYDALFEGYCTFITTRRNAHCHLAGITG